MTTERNQAVGVETVCSDSERDADTGDRRVLQMRENVNMKLFFFRPYHATP